MKKLTSSGLWASVCYQARISSRSPVLWVAVIGLVAISSLTTLNSPVLAYNNTEPRVIIGSWALALNILTPVGISVALADVFSRSRNFAGQHDTFAVLPTSLTGRLLGSLAGAVSVALIPSSLIMLLVGIVVAVIQGDFYSFSWVLVAWLFILLPSALFITTFAATLALLVPAILARIIAVLGWFWAIAWNPKLFPGPSITGTLLSPAGDYGVMGWLGAKGLWAGKGSPSVLSPTASACTAILNLAIVITITALFFFLARAIVARRR